MKRFVTPTPVTQCVLTLTVQYVPPQQFFLQYRSLILKYWCQLLLCIDLSLQEQEEKYQFTEEEVFSHAYLDIKNRSIIFVAKYLAQRTCCRAVPARVKDQEFPLASMSMSPGYFQRKNRGNKTKRIFQLFRSQ